MAFGYVFSAFIRSLLKIHLGSLVLLYGWSDVSINSLCCANFEDPPSLRFGFLNRSLFQVIYPFLWSFFDMFLFSFGDRCALHLGMQSSRLLPHLCPVFWHWFRILCQSFISYFVVFFMVSERFWSLLVYGSGRKMFFSGLCTSDCISPVINIIFRWKKN